MIVVCSVPSAANTYVVGKPRSPNRCRIVPDLSKNVRVGDSELVHERNGTFGNVLGRNAEDDDLISMAAPRSLQQ